MKSLSKNFSQLAFSITAYHLCLEEIHGFIKMLRSSSSSILAYTARHQQAIYNYPQGGYLPHLLILHSVSASKKATCLSKIILWVSVLSHPSIPMPNVEVDMSQQEITELQRSFWRHRARRPSELGPFPQPRSPLPTSLAGLTTRQNIILNATQTN